MTKKKLLLDIYISRSEAFFDCSSKAVDDVKNFERQLEELFDEVKRMIMVGNKKDAMDLLEANYEAVNERINAGARGLEEAAVLDVIALGYMAVGDFKFVGTLLEMVDLFCLFIVLSLILFIRALLENWLGARSPI